MITASLKPPTVRNILISGTNFWNPGDDFVRDGVIAVLRKIFPEDQLNFLFYNFNADFFPQEKFSGISNLAAEGDLDRYRDLVDAIVIAGLSAGDEIKDLYGWIISNKLANRVYLVGAGYENEYVAHHVSKEPESTIFKQARIITGRTRKTPEWMQRMGLPYQHVNCPAILCVPEVKEVPTGKMIERIGFSIQLPHKGSAGKTKGGAPRPVEGIVNQSCDRRQYELAVELLLYLAQDYRVEVVAHHKTEYFHFLQLLRGRGIPVLFSSFYQDLFNIYPRYDLVVSTRLHSGLFANGHGIPSIIVNDTDRHTHTLEGFPHSVWVQTREHFGREFARLSACPLSEIAAAAAEFKRNLMNQYCAVLAQALLPANQETEKGTAA